MTLIKIHGTFVMKCLLKKSKISSPGSFSVNVSPSGFLVNDEKICIGCFMEFEGSNGVAGAVFEEF